ncbi:GNAT family N-acetyltransferase [Propioniciclava flava]|uniref:N-acetyltransferase n=1 Tax=Propioniciclava flava TaxID=2072026 RepID=A0A4Q2EIH2_9ACTN|nr:GNAT family N-acetyltransferase [Propioniciclava flava]RXW33380.1 N-acetyltransferase [Propioniciclava flava]
MADIAIRNHPEAQRYEITLDGHLAGFADYMLTDGLITFTHTEIDPAYEGQGLGSQLVRAALDDVRATGERTVLPLCPFVKAWIQRHPDYMDLLYGQQS